MYVKYRNRSLLKVNEDSEYRRILVLRPYLGRAVACAKVSHSAHLYLGLLLLTAMSAIRAEPGAIYSCRDANGRTHNADRIIPECVGQKIIVRNPDGSIKREIEPQLSGEARAKKEAEEQSKREEQLRLAEQRRRDNALMSMYPREEDIERSRQRNLALPQEIIRTAETRLNEAQNRQAQLNREAEGFKGKAVPQGLKRQIEDIANNISREKNLIQDQHNDLIRINQRFDEDLKRYRALMQADSVAGKSGSAVLPAKTP